MLSIISGSEDVIGNFTMLAVTVKQTHKLGVSNPWLCLLPPSTKNCPIKLSASLPRVHGANKHNQQEPLRFSEPALLQQPPHPPPPLLLPPTLKTHQLLSSSTPAAAAAMVSSLATHPHHAHYPPPWFSIAPMMEWTDNHYRTLARLISKNAWLYTEMLAAETIVYQKDNLDRFLEYSPEQHPIVLQIGGNNLENLAKATELANPYKYDEINFNCGCPSPRVAGHGCFGASLMLDPKFVAEAMSVIAAHTDAPVSVKCRIGVDNHDSYNELCDFIYKVSSQSPTRHFIIHSRKALLNGISPAENRSIPPLKYEYFYGLLRDFPDLRFTINGGINTVEEVNAARRAGAHGVMVGRAAFNKPWHTLGHVDTVVYGAPSSGVTRRQILEKFRVYGDTAVGKYGRKPTVRDVARPLIGLFHSEPGNSQWKRKADAAFLHCTTMKEFFDETLVAIPDYVLDKPIGEPPSGSEDPFANIHSLLPPAYESKELELQYA